MREGPQQEGVQKERGPRGEVKEFFRLLPEEEEALRTRIVANHGLVRIFVHPYYQKWRGNPLVRPPKDPPEEQAKKEELNQAILRMAQLPAERTPPILFFEEEHSLDKFKSSLAGILENTFYVVPTQDAMPEPFVEPNEGFEKDSEISKRNWDTLRQKMHAYGVKKVLIGGMYFRVKSGDLSQESVSGKALAECVGVAIHHLQDDFEMDVSNFTLLEGRKEYLEARGRSKE